MELKELAHEHRMAFMTEMQVAFQQGFETKYGPTEGTILPLDDIENSLNEPNAVALEVMDGETRLGGAIISLSDDGLHGELYFLYTRVGMQNRGVATFLWKRVEERYPNVKLWETHTPYFDVRNIHFYVNRCGFHIVEFFNERHPDLHESESYSAVDPMGGEGMFRFEKRINANSMDNWLG